MNKEELLFYLQNGNMSLNIATRILVEYCKEHNKRLDLTHMFINLLINTGQLELYLVEAIDYYKRKFNICEVKRLDNNQVVLYF